MRGGVEGRHNRQNGPGTASAVVRMITAKWGQVVFLWEFY